MDKKYIDMREWMNLSPDVRGKLVEIFNIPQSGNVHVQSTISGGVVISDGYTMDDLLNVSVENMQKYLGSEETDFYKLFDKVLGKKDEVVEEIIKEQKNVKTKKQNKGGVASGDEDTGGSKEI